MIVRFSWDPRKATTNAAKYRVSFEEATTVFADPLALVVEDRHHAERSVIIGCSRRNRVLVTVFSEVLHQEIRIISARRATSRERRQYEEDD